MSKYYLLVSGEHIELAKAEISSILNMLDASDIIVSWYGKFCIIESEINPINLILNRAALVKEAGPIIAESNEARTLLDSLTTEIFSHHLGSSSSFSFNTAVFSKTNQIDRQNLIIEFGARIKKITGAKVSLKTPDTVLLLLIDNNKFYLCKSMKSILRRQLRERTPGKKIFFHPSMMNTQLSRVMCNLAEIRPNMTVLDPFCGGGGILCEAVLIGARVIGIDLNWRLLKGATANLSDIDKTKYSLIQGDARTLPIGQYNSIITDPPYGRSSSTRGAIAHHLIRSVFMKTIDAFESHGTLCICGSTELGLSEIANQLGVQLTNKILVPVHGGLVREVISAKF
ncbi:MAG: methyltransferase domain-containing protein [Candidatus Thorarchaeota archaeon]